MGYIEFLSEHGSTLLLGTVTTLKVLVCSIVLYVIISMIFGLMRLSKNSIIQGYSNKSHDGYLGNSVIGEWVNLGADTNCSNLKNTFTEAKVWDYETGELAATEEVFIGACFGDYSKTGINTMINTGSVIGVNSNVFGEGFPPKYIPSFSWGNGETYKFEKAWNVNLNIAKMAGEKLTKVDKDILKNVEKISSEIFE